jgi:hypothetical protein
VSSTSLSYRLSRRELLCISQTCTDAEDDVIRLPAVKSYALEEPATKAGKRKLQDEVARQIARISASKKQGVAQ